jgi:hypothetical protein
MEAEDGDSTGSLSLIQKHIACGQAFQTSFTSSILKTARKVFIGSTLPREGTSRNNNNNNTIITAHLSLWKHAATKINYVVKILASQDLVHAWRGLLELAGSFRV